MQSSSNLEEIARLLKAGMIVVMAHDDDEYTVTIADTDKVTDTSRYGTSAARSLEVAMEAAVLDFYSTGLPTDIFGDVEPGKS